MSSAFLFHPRKRRFWLKDVNARERRERGKKGRNGGDNGKRRGEGGRREGDKK
jgi:hypothetical protein